MSDIDLGDYGLTVEELRYLARSDYPCADIARRLLHRHGGSTGVDGTTDVPVASDD